MDTKALEIVEKRLELVPSPAEVALAKLAEEFRQKVAAQLTPPRYPPPLDLDE